MDHLPHNFSDFPARAASAVVLALCGALAVYAGGFIFLLFCAVLAGLMFAELVGLTSTEHPPWFPWVFGTVCGLTLIVVAVAAGPSLVGLFAALALVPASSFAIRGRRREFALAGMLIFLSTYEFFLLRSFIADSLWMVSWIILVVVATDISGYVFGRLLGGRSLPVWLSPEKHWSGIIAGWVSAILVSFLFTSMVGGWALWLGIAFSMAAQAGDLFESWIKRRAGVKDSSALIPGHGGVLDRFDGMAGAGALLGLLHLMFLFLSVS